MGFFTFSPLQPHNPSMLRKQGSTSTVLLYLLQQVDFLPDFRSFMISLSPHLKLKGNVPVTQQVMSHEVTCCKQLCKYGWLSRLSVKHQMQMINEFILYWSPQKVINLRK